MNDTDDRSLLIPAAVVALILFIAGFTPLETTSVQHEAIQFSTIERKSDELELGQSKIQVQGSEGLMRNTYLTKSSFIRSLFGDDPKKVLVDSVAEKAPTNQIVVNGSRRWQYMLCSNGTYRYYTNEQMKNASTGFTNSSKDSCATEGQGTKISLSDTPPASNYYSTSTYNPYAYSSTLPNQNYSYPTYSYPDTNLRFDPGPLKEYETPTTPRITTYPTKPQTPTRTCTYYQGNGVCF